MANENLLQNVYLFKELSSKELDQLNAIAQLESHLIGDEIFIQGDPAVSLYIVKYGTIRIQQRGKNDNMVNVATLGGGSHFGEMPFIDGEHRSATVTVTEPGELVRIDYDRLKGLLMDSPAIAVKVYRAMAHFLCGRLRVT